ncbi:MAG: MFS transporter [Coriobacteriales bacterium]|nr:MFS transporter [Coriobacteriales bacterium]
MEKRYQPIKAWTVAIVITLASVAFAINMFKVPAAMVQISAAFELDAISAGMLMNAVGIVSFILSIPSGMVMQRFGARRLFIILFAVNILGTSLGAASITFAPSFPMLVVSRVLEGFAYGLIGTTTTAFISAWFPIERRGLPNSIGTLNVAFGQLIILTSATFIVPQVVVEAPTFDFVNVWYFSLVALILLFILGLIFLKMPPPEESFLVGHDELPLAVTTPAISAAPAVLAPTAAPDPAAPGAVTAPDPTAPGAVAAPDPADSGAVTPKKPSMIEGFKAPAIWLMFVLFFSFGVSTSAFGIYYPEYLQNGLGLSFVKANLLTSVCTVALMIGGFVGGLVLRRIAPRKRALYLLCVCVPMPLLGFIMFNLPSADFALPFLIAYGLISQIFPGVVLTMAPEASRHYSTLGITMGVLMLGINLSGVLGVTVASIFIVNGGYTSVTIPNTLFALVGLLAAIGLVFAMRRRWAQIDATGEDIE